MIDAILYGLLFLGLTGTLILLLGMIFDSDWLTKAGLVVAGIGFIPLLILTTLSAAFNMIEAIRGLGVG